MMWRDAESSARDCCRRVSRVCAGDEGVSGFSRRAGSGPFSGAGGEVVERFRLRAHAYVLMENHYHCCPKLGEANLTRAIQWLNARYGATQAPRERWRASGFERVVEMG